MGKKAPGYFRFRGIEVERSFPGIADRPEFDDARAVAATVTGAVRGRRDGPGPAGLDPVHLGRHAAGRDAADAAAPAARRGRRGGGIDDLPRPRRAPVGYTEFEPEPEKLLAELAPRAAESEIFAALLEGAASFFTAQQRAMAAATENADELVRTLTRVMNRARQDSITTEIMEIVGGAEALRQSKGA